MIYRLGPRSLRVLLTLRERIIGGDLPAGTRLPSLTDLATEFGVASLTVRHALARLQEEGLIARIQGSGTYVRRPVQPGVLIVDDEPESCELVASGVRRAGYRVVQALSPKEGLRALEADPAIAVVLSDIRMPTAADGLAFIRAVRRRWPNLPLAAITGYPGDVDQLLGTPESPVLVLAKPCRLRHLREALALALCMTQREKTDWMEQVSPSARHLAFGTAGAT